MNLREKSNLHPQHPVKHLSVCRHFGLEERGRFAGGIELERRQRDAPVRGPRQSSESRQVRRYHQRSRGRVGVAIRGGSGSHFVEVVVGRAVEVVDRKAEEKSFILGVR